MNRYYLDICCFRGTTAPEAVRSGFGCQIITLKSNSPHYGLGIFHKSEVISLVTDIYSTYGTGLLHQNYLVRKLVKNQKIVLVNVYSPTMARAHTHPKKT